MRNLLIETQEILENNEKSFDDVKWIGTLNDGIEHVCLGLLVVGDNWWLERHEYDGSEWWEFKTIPNKPKGELRLCDIWY